MGLAEFAIISQQGSFLLVFTIKQCDGERERTFSLRKEKGKQLKVQKRVGEKNYLICTNEVLQLLYPSPSSD